MKKLTEPPHLALVPTRPSRGAEPLVEPKALAVPGWALTVISSTRYTNSTIHEAVLADGRDGRKVAVKEIGPEHIAGRDIDVFKFFDTIRREAATLIGLEHPNVVKYAGHAEENGTFYLVTGWIEGKNLADFIAEGGRFTREQANAIISQLLDAAAYLHGFAQPIIHRDIKPHNIIVQGDGSIKLVDFGFSRSEKGTGTTFFHLPINSQGFTAPEVAQGNRGTTKSDLFSIAAVYLWLRTGKSATGITEDGFTLSFPEDLEERERRFLSRALEFDPRNRFASANEMKEAFAQMQDNAQAMVKTDVQSLDVMEAKTNLRKLKKRAIAMPIISLSFVALTGLATTTGTTLPIILGSIGAILLGTSMADVLHFYRMRNAYLKRIEQLTDGDVQGQLPAPPLQLGPGRINWDRLDLDRIEIMATSPNGMTAEEAVAEAAKRGKIILSNKVIDRIFENRNLREKYSRAFPIWTGTQVDYDGENCTVTENGASKKIRLPPANGWYEVDEFGIPSREPNSSGNSDGRYLYRMIKYQGLLVRPSSGHEVCAYYGASDRLGVLVIDASLLEQLRP